MRHDEQHREKMFSLILAWQNSGLSQRAYCEQHAVRYSLFHYWYKQYREQQRSSKDNAGFVPLNVQASGGAASVELLLPNGSRLLFHQGMSPEYLKALIS